MEKIIQAHLNRYAQIRQWTDLTIWLNKLNTYLLDIKDLKANLFQEITLRLSQTLNPTLLPTVHQACIQTFITIKNRFLQQHLDKIDRIFVGVLPFFSKANVNIRIMLIKLFNQSLQFQQVIQKAGSGIIFSILPCLTQNNKNQQVAIKQLIDRVQNCMGIQRLVQSIWIGILHSRQSRYSGLKYLLQRIPCTQDKVASSDEEQLLEQILFKNQQLKHKQVKKDQYFPFLNTLIVKALIFCLQDQNQLVRKTALEFMGKHLRPSDLRLTQFSLSLLLDKSLRLLAKRDISILRKNYYWLFGKQDKDLLYDPGFVLKLILQWLKQRFEQGKDIVIAVKIMLNLMSDNCNMIQKIFTQCGMIVIRKIVKESEQDEIYKIGNRILDQIEDMRLVIKCLQEQKFNLQVYELIFKKISSFGKDSQRQLQKQLLKLLLKKQKQLFQNYDYLVMIQSLLKSLQITSTSNQTIVKTTYTCLQYSIQSQYSSHLLKIQIMYYIFTFKPQYQFIPFIFQLLQKHIQSAQILAIHTMHFLSNNLSSDVNLKKVFQKSSQLSSLLEFVWIHYKYQQHNSFANIFKFLYGLFPSRTKDFFRSLCYKNQNCIQFLNFYKNFVQDKRQKSMINDQLLDIFFMFLENNNFLVRQQTKSWLDQLINYKKVFQNCLQILFRQVDSCSFLSYQQQLLLIRPLNNHNLLIYLNRIKLLLKRFLSIEILSMQCNTQFNYLKQKYPSLSSKDKCSNYWHILNFLLVQMTRLKQLQIIGNDDKGIQYKQVRLQCLQALQQLSLILKNPLEVLNLFKFNYKNLQIALYNQHQNNCIDVQLRILQYFDRLMFSSKLLRNDKKNLSNLMIKFFGQCYLKIIVNGLQSKNKFMLQQYVQINKKMLSCVQYYLPTQIKSRYIIKLINAYMNSLNNRTDISLLSGLYWIYTFYRQNTYLQFIQIQGRFYTKYQIIKKQLLGKQGIKPMQIQRNYAKMQEIILKQIDQVLNCIINCWKLSQKFYQYCQLKKLNWQGLNQFYFDQFNQFNKDMLNIIQNRRTQSINSIILQFIAQLQKQFTPEFYPKLFSLWSRFMHNKETYALHLLQSISHLTLQTNSLPITVARIIKYCLPLVKSKKHKGISSFSFKESDNESMLLFLLYVILSFSPLNQQFYHNVINLQQIWNQISNLFTHLVNTRLPNSILWLFDLTYMLQRKINPRQIILKKGFSSLLYQGIQRLIQIFQGLSKDQYLQAQQVINLDNKYFPIPPLARQQNPKATQFNQNSICQFLSNNSYIILINTAAPLLRSFMPQSQYSQKIKDLINKISCIDHSSFDQICILITKIITTNPKISPQLKNPILKFIQKNQPNHFSLQSLITWKAFMNQILKIQFIGQSEDLIDQAMSKVVINKSYFQLDSKQNKRRKLQLRKIIILLFSSNQTTYGHQRRLPKLTSLLAKLFFIYLSLTLANKTNIISLFNSQTMHQYFSNQQIRFIFYKFMAINTRCVTKTRSKMWLRLSCLKLIQTFYLKQIEQVLPIRWTLCSDKIEQLIESRQKQDEMLYKPFLQRVLIDYETRRVTQQSVISVELMRDRDRIIKLRGNITDQQIRIFQIGFYSNLLIINQYGGQANQKQLSNWLIDDFLKLQQ